MRLELKFVSFCLEMCRLMQDVSPPQVSFLCCRPAHPVTCQIRYLEYPTCTLIQRDQKNTHNLNLLLSPHNWTFTSVSYFYFLLIIGEPVCKIICLGTIPGLCHFKCFTHQLVTSRIYLEVTHSPCPYLKRPPSFFH